MVFVQTLKDRINVVVILDGKGTERFAQVCVSGSCSLVSTGSNEDEEHLMRTHYQKNPILTEYGSRGYLRLS